MTINHVNNGNCPRCHAIFDCYPGFHLGLRTWFFLLQADNRDAHISWAGRGREDQERYFKSGASRAHYGESAHNYNLALDIFRVTHNGAEWPQRWFETVVGPAVDRWNATMVKAFEIEWYGAPGAEFFEFPHCQVRDWRKLNFPLVEK